MNIDQHRAQTDATKKLHERLEYLASLDDGQLLGLYRSLVEDMALARYRMETEQYEKLCPDFREIERMVYERMAERRTVKGYWPIGDEPPGGTP